jgi:hypothetical protein
MAMILIYASPVFAAAPVAEKTKYSKAKKQENFDAQLVEGQVYRPDLSVVTGDTSLGGFGTLKLRNDFVDHVAAETEGDQ